MAILIKIVNGLKVVEAALLDVAAIAEAIKRILTAARGFRAAGQ